MPRWLASTGVWLIDSRRRAIETNTMAALDILLDGLIDYAGLYPPASLDMQPMVEQYAMALAGEQSWVVGRVIVPANRLDEFEEAAAGKLPGHEDDDPWCVSALLQLDAFDEQLQRIAAFNDAHEAPADGMALIDAIEIRASSGADIETIAAGLPEGLFPFVEIPVDADPRGLLAALAGEGPAPWVEKAAQDVQLSAARVTLHTV